MYDENIEDKVPDSISTQPLPSEATKKNATSGFRISFNEDELKTQVEQYDTLGFGKSARKIATALLLLSVLIDVIFYSAQLADASLDIILLLVLAAYVYKGSKKALVVAMIYWTLSKFLQLTDLNSSSSSFTVFIWWFLYIRAFWQAYQVEVENKKKRPRVLSDKQTLSETTKSTG